LDINRFSIDLLSSALKIGGTLGERGVPLFNRDKDGADRDMEGEGGVNMEAVWKGLYAGTSSSSPFIEIDEN